MKEPLLNLMIVMKEGQRRIPVILGLLIEYHVLAFEGDGVGGKLGSGDELDGLSMVDLGLLIPWIRPPLDCSPRFALLQSDYWPDPQTSSFPISLDS